MIIHTTNCFCNRLWRCSLVAFATAATLTMGLIAQEAGEAELEKIRKERIELDATVFASEVEAQLMRELLSGCGMICAQKIPSRCLEHCS